MPMYQNFLSIVLLMNSYQLFILYEGINSEVTYVIILVMSFPKKFLNKPNMTVNVVEYWVEGILVWGT